MISRRAILLAPFAAIDLSEWVAADGSDFPSTSWKAEDGCLKAIGGLATFQDIKTRKLYEDFELSFEFRMPKGGNSGVKYQIEKSDKWQPKGLEGFHIRARGPEMQLSDDQENDDARKSLLKQCGALYDKIAPLHPANVNIGGFTTARLVKHGVGVEHWIGGEMLVSYKLVASKPSSIALQNHASEVWFRNLKING